MVSDVRLVLVFDKGPDGVSQRMYVLYVYFRHSYLIAPIRTRNVREKMGGKAFLEVLMVVTQMTSCLALYDVSDVI